MIRHYSISNACIYHERRSRYSNFQNIHIHCDLDAIDPLEFPFVKCPAANGLSIEFLRELLQQLLLQQLSSCFNLVGFSITEFAPIEEQGLEKITELVDKMFACFQHQI